MNPKPSIYVLGNNFFQIGLTHILGNSYELKSYDLQTEIPSGILIIYDSPSKYLKINDHINNKSPNIKRIFIFADTNKEYELIQAALFENKTNAILTLDETISWLPKVILKLENSEIFAENPLVQDLLASKLKNAKVKNLSSMLTEQEVAILKLICEEKSTREIAAIRNISPRTVEANRDKLRAKAGVTNIVGLVLYAIKIGIFTLELEDAA